MCARLLILVETMWQEALNESLGGNQMNRSNESEFSDRLDSSNLPDLSEKSHHSPTALSPSGGYRKLRSFQVAELIYDGTVIFCDRFIDKRSRTHDQMVQAARSGRQNTAEGSMAAATSKKTEIKLTNVAKASLEELLLDYEITFVSIACVNGRRTRPRLWQYAEDTSRTSRSHMTPTASLQRLPKMPQIR